MENIIELKQYVKVSKFLVQQKICTNENSARRLILEGELFVDNKCVRDADYTINKNCKIRFVKHNELSIEFVKNKK